jgi:FtsZ-interacting cell division protein ZipA
MQTDLRLLLLIVSIVLGALIVFKAFRERREKVSPVTRQAFEKSILQNTYKMAAEKNASQLHLGESDPLLEDYEHKLEDFDHTFVEIDTSMPPNAEIIEEPTPPLAEPEISVPPPEYISLLLIPRDTQAFSGEELLTVFEDENFHFGKLRMFHRHEGDDPKQPICYSIASIVEPGIFNYAEMTYDSLPGIVLWMAVKDKTALNGFEAMLHDAKGLAERLNATLCDEKRHQLTVQAIATIRLSLRNVQSMAS